MDKEPTTETVKWPRHDINIKDERSCKSKEIEKYIRDHNIAEYVRKISKISSSLIVEYMNSG